MKKIFFTLLMVGAIVATSTSCKKEDKKTNPSTSQTQTQNPNEPKSTHFPDPGEYVWAYDESMGQLKDHLIFNSGRDSIRFKKTGIWGYQYIIHKVSFSEDENRWVGIAGKSSDRIVFDSEGKYVVMYFKDIKKNSAKIIRSVFNTEAEANEFVIPANPEWGDYKRK